MTDELKPCPFCGKKPHMNFARNVWCKNPMCFMSDGNDRWGFAPIDLWNTRPIEDSQAKEIERLRAALKMYANPNNWESWSGYDVWICDNQEGGTEFASKALKGGE